MIYGVEYIISEVKTMLKSIVAKKCPYVPVLRIVATSQNPASVAYIRNKLKVAKEVGIDAKVIDCTSESSEFGILKLIDSEYEQSSIINGIIVQLPMRAGLQERYLLDKHIDYRKDVDCLGSKNISNLYLNAKTSLLRPCTPTGILWILKHKYNNKLAGKKVVIINRSNLVGKPLALMLLAENATVTLCHSHTENLLQEMAGADVIVSAVGKPNFFNDLDTLCAYRANLGKTEPVLFIDVGVSKDSSGKLCGDCSKEYYSEDEERILVTPVPGGVGQLTVLALMYNTLCAFFNKRAETEIDCPISWMK